MILLATCAVEVHTFWPRTRYPPGTFSAKVLMRVVLSPASGSVKPKAHWSSPEMRRGTQRAFCSGVPFTTIGCGPKRLMCTVEAAAIPPPWLATSCIMIAASVTPRPAPAVFLRHGDAEPPAFGHRLMKFAGKPAVLVALQPVVVVELA